LRFGINENRHVRAGAKGTWRAFRLALSGEYPANASFAQGGNIPMHSRWLGTLILLTLGGTAHASACHTQDLMPDFFAFETRTATLPPEQRADAFMRDFAPRYPDFYYYSSDGPYGRPESVRKAALAFFQPQKANGISGTMPLTEAGFHQAADETIPAFLHAETAFEKSFSDFRCDSYVGFGPSLGEFDGNQASDEQGRNHLLFGIDMIAKIHTAGDMPVVFAHELFHAYHHEVLGPLYPKNDLIVWWSMWEEGLATYMSQQLNLPQSDQDVLWLPKDLVARMNEPGATQRVAQQMLADFDAVNGAPYARWFELNHAPDGLPPRAGYYMGLKMAQSLRGEHSLSWLAHLPPDDIKVRAKAFLEQEAAAP
jgi:hypothetical protein